MGLLESKKANLVLSDSNEHRCIGMSMDVWTVTSEHRTLSSAKLANTPNIRKFMYLHHLVLPLLIQFVVYSFLEAKVIDTTHQVLA